MKKLFILSLILFFVGMSGSVGALQLSSVTGVWDNTVGGTFVNGEGTNEVRWGTVHPDGLNIQSGFRFDGNAPQTFDLDEVFNLGTFTHFNWAIARGTGATSSELTLSLVFTDPVGLNMGAEFTFEIEETPNSSLPLNNPLNNDIITFPEAFSSEVVIIDDNRYVLQLLGFGPTMGDYESIFSTIENADNETYLWAKVTSPVTEPATLLLLGTGLLGLSSVTRKKAKK